MWNHHSCARQILNLTQAAALALQLLYQDLRSFNSRPRFKSEIDKPPFDMVQHLLISANNFGKELLILVQDTTIGHKSISEAVRSRLRDRQGSHAPNASHSIYRWPLVSAPLSPKDASLNGLRV